MGNQQNLVKELDKIFSGDINFIFGANKPFLFPDESVKEIAFVGKSNVGKSSLINAFTNRKSLARVSNTPGRTQQINFFQVGDLFRIVDLPGYGYAKVSASAQKQWGKLILSYLEKRRNLKLIFLLIDSRHGIKEHDIQVMEILRTFDIKYSVVFTKADKLKKEQEQNLLQNEVLTHNIKNIYFVSTRTKLGVDAIKLAFAGEFQDIIFKDKKL